MSAKSLDPKGRLPDVEWSTRSRFKKLAARLFSETGLRLEVRSGRRSCAEQNRIYAAGRTAPGDIQTYAAGCRSWHTLGRAVDAYVVLPDGRRSGAQSDYEKAGRLWESRFGGVWGGDFAGFGPGGDAGHFEYHPGLTTEQVCPTPSRCAEAVAQWGKSQSPYLSIGLAASGLLLGVGGAYLLWRKGS